LIWGKFKELDASSYLNITHRHFNNRNLKHHYFLWQMNLQTKSKIQETFRNTEHIILKYSTEIIFMVYEIYVHTHIVAVHDYG